MNRVQIVLATAFVLGVSAFVYSQEPGAEQKPQRQEEPRRGEVAPPRQEVAPPRQEAPRTQKPERPPNPNEPNKAAPAQKNQPSRPVGKSARIPDPKFKASFGRRHPFHAQVINTRTVVAGQTQFIYAGYTFIILDPWPADWL